MLYLYSYKSKGKTMTAIHDGTSEELVARFKGSTTPLISISPVKDKDETRAKLMNILAATPAKDKGLRFDLEYSINMLS